MKNTNDIIKAFDNSEDHIEQLQLKLRSELNGLPLMTRAINKNQKIFRCRNIKKVSDYPLFENEISYRPDKENITSIGRCNWERSSKFYGSIQSDELPGDVTAISEISSLIQNDKEGSEQYAVGVWEATETFSLMVIKPPSLKLPDSKVVTEFRNVFNKELENNQVTDDKKEFLELYGREMIKKVFPNENEKYTLSALVSETILDYQPGMIYTSVQSAHKGLNVVMNTNDFDNHFYLKHVVIGEFFKFKNISAFRPTLVCANPRKTPFHYELPPEKERSTNEEIIALFERQGIPHSYIVDILTRQMAQAVEKV